MRCRRRIAGDRDRQAEDEADDREADRHLGTGPSPRPAGETDRAEDERGRDDRLSDARTRAA
jgi:hypothetical protein